MSEAAPWAWPPEGTFLAAGILDGAADDNCFFNRSISAACDLMVSLSSLRAEEEGSADVVGDFFLAAMMDW